MAYNDATIKQNDLIISTKSAILPTKGTPEITSGEKNSILPLNINEELLKKLGITVEQYSKLSDRQKEELLKQVEQFDGSNLGVKGLYVESTSDHKLDTVLKDPESIQIKTSKDLKDNVSIKDEIRSNQKITKEDWKNMSSDERFTYLKLMTDEFLNEIPEDKRKDVIKELLDNRIKSDKGFSDEKWLNMSDDRKDRLRNKFLSDFNVIVENGFTKEEYEALSYVEKLRLEIDSKSKLIETIEKNNSKSAKDDVLLSDLKTQVNRKTKEVAIAKTLDTIAENSDSKYAGIIDKFNSKYQTENLPHEDRCKAFVRYVMDEELAKVPEEERLKVLTNIIVSIYKENEPFGLHLLAEAGLDPNILKSLAQGELTPEVIDLMGNINTYIKKNGSNDLTDEQTVGMARFYDRAATNNSPESISLAVDLRNTYAAQSRLAAVEEFSRSNNEEIQKTHYQAVQAAKTPDNRVKIYQMTGNLKNDEIRREQTSLGLEGADADTQVKSQKALLEKTKGDKFVLHGFNDALASGYIKKEAQVDFAQNTMNGTNFLADNEAIEVQKGLADANIACDAENQNEIFKIIMSSKFDDVQEYAASNIYKLDESVRDIAADYAKSLGKENISNAVKTEPPAQETPTVRSKTSEDYPDSEYNVSQKYATNPVNDNVIIQENITANIEESDGKVKLDLSSQEDCNKLVAFFEKYPTEMAKYIATTSHRNKEDVLIALCNSSKTAALAFFKSNPSLGAIILNCSKIDLATQTDIALIMVKNCPKGSDDWNVAMKYLGKYYKQDDKENSNEKSISFKA